MLKACGAGDEEDVNCAYLLDAPAGMFGTQIAVGHLQMPEALPAEPRQAAEKRQLLDCQCLPRACWVSVLGAQAANHWQPWLSAISTPRGEHPMPKDGRNGHGRVWCSSRIRQTFAAKEVALILLDPLLQAFGEDDDAAPQAGRMLTR